MIRRIELAVVAAILLLAAFSTGVSYLFFLVYVGLLVVGGAYLISRFGLSDLEAGFALDRVQATVGETLRATYTLRNTSRLPKLWLETFNGSTLPVPLPGRALALGPRGERSWAARVPLVRRGHFRIDPLTVRTGDPLGLFEASATVGTAAAVTVYPRVEPLPGWRLPATSLEGNRASRDRTLQTTPLVTSIRPYLPGDAFNRIHWPTTARQGELQVKEFDLEQTADLWIFLDLDRSMHVGHGDESTLEAGVRVAAALAGHALLDNRAVGLTASGRHSAVLPADRGGRQHHKIMRLLAAVEADGQTPLVEVLLQGLVRLRRGMTAAVITSSLDRDWVLPLSTLRVRGVATVVCRLDAAAYAEHAVAQGHGPGAMGQEAAQIAQTRARADRAMRHALAEYDLRAYEIVPGHPLGELLSGAGPRAAAAGSGGAAAWARQ
ncbi:MAG TPA: DUF58 domain-containing protein [Candidatus Limnocylindrales bacterium]|nr:DUF58 domain-containing protein [Candidatus Limnocylindrales bacterium]